MVTKLDQYTESPEIDIEKIKAIANSLSDSDTVTEDWNSAGTGEAAVILTVSIAGIGV